MEGSEFDEVEFFRGVQTSGTRALLVGRRALVILGLPVLARRRRKKTVRADRYRPSPEVVAKIRALSERQLSAEEVEAALGTPIEDAEREEILSLVAWFRRRYPTPADRLAYVRRAYRRSQASFDY